MDHSNANSNQLTHQESPLAIICTLFIFMIIITERACYLVEETPQNDARYIVTLFLICMILLWVTLFIVTRKMQTNKNLRVYLSTIPFILIVFCAIKHIPINSTLSYNLVTITYGTFFIAIISAVTYIIKNIYTHLDKTKKSERWYYIIPISDGIVTTSVLYILLHYCSPNLFP